ncbi:hypothetical protein HYI36_20125 [Bacillus sp. Gen3]|nr:hypothetical protein [Bacillus sp. Gen3]
MTNKVMEILKADEKANAMLTKFERNAEAVNMVGEQYREARKTMLALIIACTPAARNAMADEIWEEVNV